MSKPWTKARSEHANLCKKLGPDDPLVIDKRVELRALRLEDYVQRVLAEAPPLSAEQRERIAELLRPGRRSETGGGTGR